jgi:heptosyltransferase-3
MPEPRSLLVIVTQQLGDVLLASPLVHTARERWPTARIDVLGFAGTLKLLAGNPEVDTLIEAPRGGWRASLPLVRRLWRAYDLALVTQSGDRPFLYGLVAARQRSTLVPLTGPGRGWKRAVSQHVVVGDPARHTVMEKLELLRPWLDLTTVRTSLVPPALEPLPADLVAALRPRHAVVHVPSMWPYKQWPVAHFRTLIAGLVEGGWQVVLTGDAGANDQGLVAGVRDVAQAPALLDASGRLTLAQVATLLVGAAVYVGPDTSVTHLAAAVGTPVVTLFGPTSPLNWGPWPAGHPARQPWQARGAEPQRVQRQGGGAEALAAGAGPVAATAAPATGAGARGRIVLMQGPSLPGTDCVPCRRMGCEDRRESRSACLEGIAPQAVLDEVRALVGPA